MILARWRDCQGGALVPNPPPPSFPRRRESIPGKVRHHYPGSSLSRGPLRSGGESGLTPEFPTLTFGSGSMDYRRQCLVSGCGLARGSGRGGADIAGVPGRLKTRQSRTTVLRAVLMWVEDDGLPSFAAWPQSVLMPSVNKYLPTLTLSARVGAVGGRLQGRPPRRPPGARCPPVRGIGKSQRRADRAPIRVRAAWPVRPYAAACAR